MHKQIIVYCILGYDILFVAFIIKKLFTIPGNKKLLNQYKKKHEKKKDNKAYYLITISLFLLGLIYLLR